MSCRPAESIAFLHSLQAVLSVSVDFSGHILKVATLIAPIISALSLFLPCLPLTLDVILTSCLKKFLTRIVAKFGLEILSLSFL